MITIRNTTDFKIEEPTAVSIGKFDGLHTGHEYLLQALFEKKEELSLKTVVFTFDMPPQSKVDASEEKVLTTNVEREMLFQELGIDYLIECPFTEEVMRMQPESFIQMMSQRLSMRFIVAGTDCGFGYRRSGNANTLSEFAQQYQYEARIVQKKQYDGKDISSTLVREKVKSGNMEQVTALLGYPYFVSGTVLHGNALGRTIGIPTINVIPAEEKLLPPFGVYASSVQIDGKTYIGIANVGRKPTVGMDNPVGVEMHILDYHEMIYNKEVRISLHAFERAEEKFGSIEELKAQIQKDITFARKFFKE